MPEHVDEPFFPDARIPTERERRELCEMLFHALVEMRFLGNSGKAEQAADLAHAFHNLPIYLWSDQFSFSFFREFLETYQTRYPAERGKYSDYIAMLDRIVAGKGATGV